MTNGTTLKIGRYEIQREIGRGGMAVVFLARDPRLDRVVALKLIRSGAFPDEHAASMMERFRREAKALAKLNHPNIVKVLDYGDYQGAPFLVMEYLEGGTLKDIKKPIRVDAAVRLIRPVAEALRYVHHEGLLHRDVKPSNIMITNDRRVVLTDFGIAKWIHGEGELRTLTGTGVGIGTPEYMAPEQGRGKQVDERSDLYALAIVLYELVTGVKPFHGDTAIEVLVKQATEPIPDPRQFVPELPDAVVRFLFKALAKRADDRYSSMHEFLHELTVFQAGTTVVNSPPRPIPFSSASGRRNWDWKMTLMALIALCVLGLGIYVVTRDGTNGGSVLSPIPGVNQSNAKTPTPNLNIALQQTIIQITLDVYSTEAANLVNVSSDLTQTAEADSSAAQTQIFIMEQTLTEAARPNEPANVSSDQDAGIAPTPLSVISFPTLAQPEPVKARRYSNLSVGDIIDYGAYEQDLVYSNGEDPIEWIVLEITEGKALLISRYVIDALWYDEDYAAVTWRDCTLRGWLNNDFYTSAFNSEEKRYIEKTHIETSVNSQYGVNSGEATDDFVFILNYQQIQKYFPTNESRLTLPTEFAKNQDVFIGENGRAFWWVLTPGQTRLFAMGVKSFGAFDTNGVNVQYYKGGVRPAIWLRLKER